MASDSIFFKEVYGILAPRKFDFDPVEKNDILETQDIDGQVRLNDFEMVFDIYNSLGVDNMLLTLDMKGYKKDKAGTELDTIRLEFTGNNTFAISPGENGTPVRSTLILDKSNSNIVDFMAFLPTDIELWGITTLGGDGKVSHVSLEHAVWANYSIYSPLFLEIPSDIFVTSDMSTIDTDDEVRNNIENINYVNLQMEVVNGLPIGADLAVHISTDSLDLFSDAISDPTEKIIIEGIASPAAEVNENGYVLEPVWDKENHIRLDEEQMKIFQNEILYVGTKMRLGQTAGVVKFRTSDMIQSNGFIKVNYQMNSEE
jgi:hypothetical protein